MALALAKDAPASAAALSALVASLGPELGLPEGLRRLLEPEQGTARSGCDDGFGVFGFLAFLLALLDLLLDLNEKRRKRGAEECGGPSLASSHPQVRYTESAHCSRPCTGPSGRLGGLGAAPWLPERPGATGGAAGRAVRRPRHV